MVRAICKTIVALLLLSGCVKDKPQPAPIAYASYGDVLIACEGSLGNGNATLYAYSRDSNVAHGDVYASINQEQLGDVFQSITACGDSLYLCINNSDKIIVLHKKTLKKAGEIAVPKPRYLVQVSPTEAWVSSLYGNKVYKIDIKNLTVATSISLGADNPEGMYAIGHTLYICTWDTASTSVSRIDLATNSLLPPIPIVGNAPHAILADKQGMLWVMSGNVIKAKPAHLTRIDPSTGIILNSYAFPPDMDPIKPIFNTTKDTLYYIAVKYDGTTTNNGIFRMPINSASLPTDAFVKADPYQYFWAVATDPLTANVYVADPRGFVQKGQVFVYKPDGTLVTTFTTGLGPGQFHFPH